MHRKKRKLNRMKRTMKVTGSDREDGLGWVSMGRTGPSWVSGRSGTRWWGVWRPVCVPQADFARER